MNLLKLESDVSKEVFKDSVERLTNLLILHSSTAAYKKIIEEAKKNHLSIDEYVRRKASNLLSNFTLHKS